MKSYSSKLTFLLSIALLGLYNIGFSQFSRKENLKELSVSEFISALQKTDVEKIILTDVIIIIKDKEDEKYSYRNGNSNQNFNWDSLVSTFPAIVSEKEIYMQNIYFSERMFFPNITFKSYVHIEDVGVYGDLAFRNCSFESVFYCVKYESYFLDIVNCTFKERPLFESVKTEEFTIQNSSFHAGVNFYQNDEPLNLSFVSNNVSGQSYFQSMRGGGEVLISHSNFKATTKNSNETIMIGGGQGFLDRLIMVNDTFAIPLNFSGSKISTSFLIDDCILYDYNSFKNISLPENSTNIRWKYVKSFKLGIRDKNEFFNGRSTLNDTTEENYFDLIKVYTQFLKTYKNNGDQESYNACYIEMKNIQSNKAYYNFKSSPGIKSFFDWVLTRFLKVFCDYGTNPVKAILMSIVVICLFGILYFVFPSDGSKFSLSLFWHCLWNKRRHRFLYKYLLAIGSRLLNSLALSMNAFVTLGYGDMPAKGVARYLAVLEGLTGWFLLSIFSSSLISQMLQ